MIIESTFYPHEDLHKCTWRSLDGVTFSQIDHHLIERGNKSNLRDVSSYRGASIVSNYCLVIACLRAQISNVVRVTGIRTNKYNVTKLAEKYK
jgi:hypothetical protein